jgi:hypothetical protein
MHARKGKGNGGRGVSSVEIVPVLFYGFGHLRNRVLVLLCGVDHLRNHVSSFYSADSVNLWLPRLPVTKVYIRSKLRLMFLSLYHEIFIR